MSCGGQPLTFDVSIDVSSMAVAAGCHRTTRSGACTLRRERKIERLQDGAKRTQAAVTMSQQEFLLSVVVCHRHSQIEPLVIFLLANISLVLLTALPPPLPLHIP